MYNFLKFVVEEEENTISKSNCSVIVQNMFVSVIHGICCFQRIHRKLSCYTYMILMNRLLVDNINMNNIREKAKN